ncbi:MAG: PilZ domain-containing protein [Deltaproteobacteria bacterium]|nr:PilZ domain-containing protein [Deltaproteobacteria bacterium]
MEEKRKLRRRYMLAEVKIKSSESQGWIEAVMLNISRGGIGLYASEPLKKREKVSIKITYMEGQKPVEAEEIPGLVSWVQPVGGRFGAGIMFEAKVNRLNFPILSRCLEYARSNK